MNKRLILEVWYCGVLDMNKKKGLHWVGVHHPMTYLEVKSTAEELGANLPEDYCTIIGAINGGALRSAFIEFPLKQRISYSRNVSLNKEAKANIFLLYKESSDFDKRYFPFGSVGNGDYFCFDLVEHNVVLWQHEIDKFIYICQSYSDLLNMIQERDD